MTERLELSSMALAERKKQVRFAVKAPASPDVDERLLEDLHELCEVQESSTAFILVHSHTRRHKPKSSLKKKLAKKLGEGGGGTAQVGRQ
jgi:KUP system potassium uptake protein